MAAAFFWGGGEALLNRYLPPEGTWKADSLLYSAYAREIFYAAVVGAGAASGGLVILVIKKIRAGRSNSAGATYRWRGPVAAAAIIAASAGWLVLGIADTVVLKLVFFNLDLRYGVPFAAYWGFFAIVAAAVTWGLRTAVRRMSVLRKLGGVLRVVGAGAFVVVIVLQVGWEVLRPRPRGPNVIVIVLDAWRGDAFRPEVMPNLDEFARRHAVVFPRAWSCASWTLPSMASIFTGQYPDVHGVRHGPLARTLHPTFAQVFRAAGYDTYAFVGNRLLDRHDPIGAGFDHFFFWDWWPPLGWIHFYDTHWYGPAVRNLLHRPLGPETSRVLTAKLLRHLARPHRRPYLLWVHYMDPHVPYSPPPSFCRPEDIPFITYYHPRLKKYRRVYHRLYENECTFVDSLLKPALDEIAAHPDIVLVVTSDHGEEFWEHKTFEHGKSVYETVTRVPLIIRVPGEGPRLEWRPVSQIDLARTVLSLAGLTAPDTMSGRSLFDAGEAGRQIFIGSKLLQLIEYRPERQDAIIVWPRKLILYHDRPADPGEYYDLNFDPGETMSLPEDSMSRQMRELYYVWRKEVTAGKGESEKPYGSDASARDLRALGYIK